MSNILSTNNQSSKRINVVDCLRGFAIVGIILVHFLEHLNFYNFPEPTAFEQNLWDIVFYLGSNKMYAIFSLLFGLSCYIQHHNREMRGEDFRPRFAWRMLLLLGWGFIDLAFYNGDILCIYAVLGLFLIPLVKAKDWVLVVCAVVLFCQPIEIVYIIIGLLDSNATPINLGIDKYWQIFGSACAEGSFLDVAKAGVKYGFQDNFGWALEYGRFTQTIMLFIVGMLIGRKRLFLNEGNNMIIWKNIILFVSIPLFIITQLVYNILDFSSMQACISRSLDTLIIAWRNFAMMSFYVAGITLLYYNTSLRKYIEHLSYIGKMSLTDYLLQSIIGGFLFYNWGLGLYRICSHGYSLLLGIAFIIFLYIFCHIWGKHFRRGPLEEIWARLTNIQLCK